MYDPSVPLPNPDDSQSGGRRKNAWLTHVKATMRGNRNKSFKQVLKIAKKTYRKHNKSQGKSRSKHHRRSRQSGGNPLQQLMESQEKKQGGGGNLMDQLQQSQEKKQGGGGGVGGGKEGMSAFGANAGSVA
jgi:hypothetical protein